MSEREREEGRERGREREREREREEPIYFVHPSVVACGREQNKQGPP